MDVFANNRGLWASQEAWRRFKVHYWKNKETIIQIKDKVVACGYHAAARIKANYYMVHATRDVKGRNYFRFNQAMFQYADPVRMPKPQKGDYVLSVGTKHKNHMLCKGIKNLVISTNPRYKECGGRFPKAKVLYHVAPNDYGEYLKMLAKARVVVIPVKKHKGLTAGITTVVDAIAMNKWVVTNEDLSDYIIHGKNGYIVKDNEIRDAVKETKEPVNDMDLSYTACLSRIEEICRNISRRLAT